MTPIIDPKIFYWITVLSDLDFIATVVFTLFAIAFLGIFIMSVESKENYFKNIPKLAYITAVFALAMVIFIPSADTCYKMLVADSITYENVEDGAETAKEIVDYIFEKINEE